LTTNSTLECYHNPTYFALQEERTMTVKRRQNIVELTLCVEILCPENGRIWSDR